MERRGDEEGRGGRGVGGLGGGVESRRGLGTVSGGRKRRGEMCEGEGKTDVRKEDVCER